MSGTPTDPPERPPWEEAGPTGRSRYEDYDLSDVTVPKASARRRTPTITVAALVLAVSGVLPLITALAFRPGGGGTIALLALSAAELIGATLVFLLHPLGRPVGIALGCLGIVLAVITATGSPPNAIVGLSLNGFVIYAVASSGSAFRRG